MSDYVEGDFSYSISRRWLLFLGRAANEIDFRLHNFDNVDIWTVPGMSVQIVAR